MNSDRAGAGGRPGVERLSPVLSLDDAAEHPEKLASLPLGRLYGLLRDARVAVAHLEHAAAVAALQGPHRGQQSPDGDQLISRAEAAHLLGVTPRFLRSLKLPGRIRLGPKTTAYRKADLLKFVRQRASQQ
jgi:hypothetical protein